jgi:hypothetical protein
MSHFIYDYVEYHYAECLSDECRCAQILDLTKERFAIDTSLFVLSIIRKEKFVKIVAPVDSVRKHYFFFTDKEAK